MILNCHEPGIVLTVIKNDSFHSVLAVQLLLMSMPTVLNIPFNEVNDPSQVDTD